MNIERRNFPLSELRAKKDGLAIEGHAAVFNQLSEDLGGFKEMVRPGAFARSIQNDDVRALWNHDANFVLGRTKNKTLSLREDETGLAMENALPDTGYARDFLKVIDRGDVDQMSFGFRTLRDDWRLEAGLVIRELIEVQLFDVSPATFPAYPQTDVAARGLFESKISELKKAAEIPPEKLYQVKLLRRRLDLAARI